MKKEIICPGCAVQQRDLFPTDQPYPGEFVSINDGTALDDYICDLCGVQIPAGSACATFSIWTNRRPFIPWESEYVKLKENPND